MAEEKLTSVKRFGTRYGRTTKVKFNAIEVEQRKKHKCPYCNAVAVKRLSLGIWQCKKCDAKFTGRAYTITKKPVEQAPVEKKIIAEDDDDDESYEEDNEVQR